MSLKSEIERDSIHLEERQGKSDIRGNGTCGSDPHVVRFGIGRDDRWLGRFTHRVEWSAAGQLSWP